MDNKMKVKKTKTGYSFKGECTDDYKLLGELVSELGKRKIPQENDKEEKTSAQVLT
jgi:hypothetical protein